jgi:O-antigen/teichoic acid export membrane protein
MNVQPLPPKQANRQPRACKNTTVLSEIATKLGAKPVAGFLASFFTLLNENEIRYCVLKSEEAVAACDASTLEVAVDPRHRNELPRLFHGLPKERYRPVQCIRLDVDTDHFHFALLDSSPLKFFRVEVLCPARNSLSFRVDEELFFRRQWQENCWRAAPSDELSYILGKASRTGILTSVERESLKALVERLGRAKAETIAGQLFGSAIKTEVVAGCTKGSLGAILPTLSDRVRQSNPLHRSLLEGIRKGWRWILNWIRPTGLVITILGPDGAGKTTISTEIFALLGSGFGAQKLLLWRPEVLPRLSQNPATDDLPHSKPPRGALQSIARVVAVFLDYWVGHFVMVKPLLSRSALILYDRDFHDLLVDHRRYRYGGPSWVPPLLARVLPRTESIFLCLDAAPEVILERKQEVPPEELHRQLAAYRGLAAELPNSYIIRTDSDLKGTSSEVARSVVDYLGSRYERRYVLKQGLGSGRVSRKRLQAWGSTVRGAVADLYSQGRSWLRKGFQAVLDQGLISGSNFVLGILLARWLRAEQYGAYALSFAIFIFFSFLQQGLLLEPMSVFGPSIYRKSHREYLGTLVWLQGALAGIFLVPGAVAATRYLQNDTGLLQKALLGMIFSAPCVLLFWFARRAFYLQLQPGRAVAGAVLYCALLSICVWLLVRAGLLSPFTAFLAMGVAALLTSLRQLRQLRPILTREKITSDLRDVTHRHWCYGRWAVLGSLFIWIPWNVYYPVVGHFSGLAEVANLRALLNLALPMTQTLAAFTLLFLPHASHVSDQKSWAGARVQALRIAAFFALGSVLYWLPVCLFRASLLQFLYAGHYSQVAPLIPWIGLSSVLSGVALGPTIAFRAMQSPASVCFMYFVSSGVSLAFGVPATRLFGVRGAVICNLLSSLTAAVIGWTMLTRQECPQTHTSTQGLDESQGLKSAPTP